MGMSLANLFITKTFSPTGGVINPTSTTIKVSIPNQIAVSSEFIPKSKFISIGKKTALTFQLEISSQSQSDRLSGSCTKTAAARMPWLRARGSGPAGVGWRRRVGSSRSTCIWAGAHQPSGPPRSGSRELSSCTVLYSTGARSNLLAI